MNNSYKSGYVSIVGKPNIGKSTLLNSIALMELSIVTPKPQTTRKNIKYIFNDENSQIIFLDTPGIHVPKTKLGSRMLDNAISAISDSDLMLFMIDPNAYNFSNVEKQCIKIANDKNIPIILLINKIDTIDRSKLLPLIAKYNDEMFFEHIYPISAKKSDGIKGLIDLIKGILPEGPIYYPVDYYTDQTERDIASEIIREKILMQVNEEIPHGTAVEIQSFKENVGNKDHLRNFAEINAVIYCEKESHKRIIIGSDGEKIKNIGTQARLKLEKVLDRKIHLELYVKISKDWRNKITDINNLGF